MKTFVLEADELTQKSDALATRYPHEQDEAERKKIYRELRIINDRACKVELLANEYQDKIKKRRNLDNSKVQPASLTGETIYARVSRRSFGNGSLKPNRVLASAPEGQRMISAQRRRRRRILESLGAILRASRGISRHLKVCIS